MTMSITPESGRTKEFLAELRIVAVLIQTNIRFRLAHRVDFLSAAGASAIGTVASFAFLPLLFSRVPLLGEWKPAEVVFLYGFSLIPLGLFNSVSMNLYEFPEKVVFEGRFDRLLLRPQSTMIQVLFDTMRVESLQETIVGIGLLAWASPRVGVTWGLARIAALALFAVSGAFVYVATFSALTAVSFRFEDRVGLVPPVYNLIAFSRYPLTIYSIWIRVFLSTVIPFAFASFYPASRLLGRLDWTPLAIASPIVGILAMVGASKLWEREVLRYSGSGT